MPFPSSVENAETTFAARGLQQPRLTLGVLFVLVDGSVHLEWFWRSLILPQQSRS